MRDLEADLKLCEAATDGPWGEIYYDHTVAEHPHWSVDCDLPCSLTVAIMGAGYGQDGEAEANAKFIAAAREGWPETIRELMEARKRIEELEKATGEKSSHRQWAESLSEAMQARFSLAKALEGQPWLAYVLVHNSHSSNPSLLVEFLGGTPPSLIKLLPETWEGFPVAYKPYKVDE